MVIKMIGTLMRYNKAADSHQRTLRFISLVTWSCPVFSLHQAPSPSPCAMRAPRACIASSGAAGVAELERRGSVGDRSGRSQCPT